MMVAIGNRWALLMIIPGVACSSLLFRYAPSVKSAAMTSTGASLRDARSNVKPILIVVLVIAIRSGAMSAVIFLAPLYFHAQGLPASWGSYGSSIFLLVGSFAGLYAGRLSDRTGRKPVVFWSLVIASPLVLLVGLVPGLSDWVIMAFAGCAILASNSVTVVQAQEILPGNAGLAAGLTLGLGFGLSGVITFILAGIAKQTGAQHTIWLAALLPLLAAALALGLPGHLFPHTRVNASIAA